VAFLLVAVFLVGILIKIEGNPALADGLHHDRLLSASLDVIIAAFVPGDFQALDALRRGVSSALMFWPVRIFSGSATDTFRWSV